nr:hypothetical protein [Lachnospiraceae bacterium]
MFRRRFLTRLTRLGLATYIMTYCMAFTVCAAENPIADLAVADSVQMVENQVEADAFEDVTPAPVETVEADETAVEEEAADEVMAVEAEEEEEDAFLGNTYFGLANNQTITSGGNHIIPLEFTHNADDPDNIRINYSVDGRGKAVPDGVSVTQEDGGFRPVLSVPSNCPECVFFVDGTYTEDGTDYPSSCRVKVYIAPSGIVPFINGTSVYDNRTTETAIPITNISNPVQIKLAAASEDDPVLVADRISWKAFEKGESGETLVGESHVAFEETGNDTCDITFTEECLGKTYRVRADYNNSYIDASEVRQHENDESCFVCVYFNVSGEPANDYFYNITQIYLSTDFVNVTESTVGIDNCEPVSLETATDGETDNLDYSCLNPAKIVWKVTERGNDDISKFYDSLYGVHIDQSTSAPQIANYYVDSLDGITKPVDIVCLYYNNDTIGAEDANPVIARITVYDPQHQPKPESPYYYNITELYVTPSSINATTKDPQTVVIDSA